MDEAERKIRANLKRIAREHGPDVFFDGTVTSVDADNYLCDVELDTGGTIFEARLRAAATGNKSIDVLPVVGTSVVMVKIFDDEYLVLCADEISNYRATVGDMSIDVSAEGIELRNGTESMKAIMSDLMDQILGIYAPKDIPALTAIKIRFNNLLK